MTAEKRSPTPQAIPTPQSIRLYIAPLAPSLLSTVLPQNLQATALDISYHSPQTFPEKPYGYVTLTTTEAHKLKSKLNGLILRGIKMRVEDARPVKRHKREINHRGASNDATEFGDANGEEEESPEKQPRTKRPRGRKNKDGNGNGVLEGIALPPGRNVKRGWTQSETRDRRTKKESEKGEMVFRTNLPPNVASNVSPLHENRKSPKKDRKGKNPSKSGKATEVTEFDRTTKYPSFLRDTLVPVEEQRATEFVEGIGWVDEDGNVVETIRSRPNRRTHIRSTSDDTARALSQVEIQETSSNDIDEGGKSDLDKSGVRPASHSSSPAAKVHPKSIHPLEALFKRPPPRSTSHPDSTKVGESHRPAPIKTSFNFFSEERGDDEGDDSGGVMTDGVRSMAPPPPQTPFTRQDMEMRGIRSAAPTPDTAAIGRAFRMPWRRGTGDTSELSGTGMESEDDANDDDANDKDGDAALMNNETTTENGHQSAELNPADDGDDQKNEFEKHFWQHRADYNRAWRSRKREAKKEARKSENRGRGGVGRR